MSDSKQGDRYIKMNKTFTFVILIVYSGRQKFKSIINVSYHYQCHHKLVFHEEMLCSLFNIQSVKQFYPLPFIYLLIYASLFYINIDSNVY